MMKCYTLLHWIEHFEKGAEERSESERRKTHDSVWVCAQHDTWCARQHNEHRKNGTRNRDRGMGRRRRIACAGTTPLFVHQCDDDDDDQTRSSFSSVNTHSWIFFSLVSFVFSSEANACECVSARECICISLTLCAFLIFIQFSRFSISSGRSAITHHLLCNALMCIAACSRIGRSDGGIGMESLRENLSAPFVTVCRCLEHSHTRTHRNANIVNKTAQKHRRKNKMKRYMFLFFFVVVLL